MSDRLEEAKLITAKYKDTCEYQAMIDLGLLQWLIEEVERLRVLREKMATVDPEANELLKKIESLESQLREQIGLIRQYELAYGRTDKALAKDNLELQSQLAAVEKERDELKEKLKNVSE